MNRRDFIKTAGVVTVGLMIDGQPIATAKENPQMKISAVKLYDGGFMMKTFACGGGLPEGSIPEQKLRSSLQNYVIDTGDEVILVDTGFPAEENFPVTEDSMITFGDKVNELCRRAQGGRLRARTSFKNSHHAQTPRPHGRTAAIPERQNFHFANRSGRHEVDGR